MASGIVTLPKELTASAVEEQERFFQVTADYFGERYGTENIVSVRVHYDEGKHLKLRDTRGDPLCDEEGRPITEFHLGQPHVHVCWIPACKIDHEELFAKKHHVKKMELYDEKISANDVLNRQDFQTFHKDLQQYLEEHGVHCKILTGITKAQGGNRTVKEYKEEFEQIREHIESIERVNEDLRSQIQDLTRENDTLHEQVREADEVKQTHQWGDLSEWGKERDSAWGRTF